MLVSSFLGILRIGVHFFLLSIGGTRLHVCVHKAEQDWKERLRMKVLTWVYERQHLEWSKFEDQVLDEKSSKKSPSCERDSKPIFDVDSIAGYQLIGGLPSFKVRSSPFSTFLCRACKHEL
jgi:hypothetical protein